MACNEICILHKAIKSVIIGRYFNTQKRYQICDIFTESDGLRLN